MNIVIIGNGIAGLSAAEEIRKRNKEVVIHMITNENYHTYYRTQLSHFLSKDFKLEDIYIRPEKWYEENGIEVHLNKEVKNIDKNNKVLKLSNNQEVKYDKLLIANGASSFVPPVEGVDKQGMFTLRGLDDLKGIQEHARKSTKGIVVGGGLLGLEAANSLKKLGLDITVIEFFDRLLPRQLDSEGSQVLKEIVEGQGVNLLLGAQVENINGEGKVAGCKIKEGQDIEADLILFSAGVRSNIQLAKDIGLEINRAIVVDKFMKTSEEDIYAAGDVCEFNEKSFAIWPIAMEQGKVAGANIIGERQEYKEITPSNMLDVMGSKVFSTGDIGAGEVDYETLKIIKADNIFKKLFFLDGKLVGGILINNIENVRKLNNLMSAENDYTELLSKDISQEDKLNQLL